MFKRSWFLVCLSLMCVLSFSISAFATSQVNITIPYGEDFVRSEYVTLPDTDVLIWNVINTSNEDLHYRIEPRPFGWCGTVFPLASGVVKPGETICGSALGADNPGDFHIRLYGASGYATLSVK